MKRIAARFYRTPGGSEPVRIWLKSLKKDDRVRVGVDIKTLEFGWPIGMPLSRDLGHGLREVRTRLIGRRIARTLFHVERNEMVLLHGFIKKSQRTPLLEIRVAQQRLAEVLNER